MENQLIPILLSVIIVSLISLVGVISLSLGKKKIKDMLIVFVAFASGTLLAASFLHMMPEAVESIGEKAYSMVLIGILIFFFIEKFIHWHHCGKEECKVHPVAQLNLIGDGMHNFIDGIIIAAAYLTDFQLGIITTIVIILHEIPQEFGDFSILLHSGMSTRKALTYNFISATAAIIGAILGYLLLVEIREIIPYAIALSAGGFIYIATADLMPELHRHTHPKKTIYQSIALLVGVLLLSIIFQYTPHA